MRYFSGGIMHADNFKLADYLARIGFEEGARADVATLTQMMRCHVIVRCRFENFRCSGQKNSLVQYLKTLWQKLLIVSVVVIVMR